MRQIEQSQSSTSIAAGASQVKRTAPQWQPPAWVTRADTAQGLGADLEGSTRIPAVSPACGGEAPAPALKGAGDGAGDGIRTHDPNLGKVVLYP